VLGYYQVHRELQAVSDEALASVVPSIKTVTMLAQLHILATLHLRGFALVLGKADSTLIVPTKPIACRWPRRAFPRSSGHDEGGLGRGL